MPKIAILDAGFQGYAELLGRELPASVQTRSFRADGDITGGGSKHGTGVAEIAYDIASEAQFYLVNFQTSIEFQAAVDWLIQQHVHVVNASFGFPCAGPLDGSGGENAAVARAKQAGILWVNAAGNQAKRHWSGAFGDPNENMWHNFASNDETNTIQLRQGDGIRLCLEWDDWSDRNQDYDLYLFNEYLDVVASSTTWQSGANSPTEIIDYSVPSDGSYHVGIRKYSASRTVKFHLHILSRQAEGCAATVSLEESPNAADVLTTLRVFRDGVLAKSEFGQAVTAAFYRHSPETTRLLLLNADLRGRVSALLTKTKPVVQSVVSQQQARSSAATTPLLTAGLINEVEATMDALGAALSPAAATDLQRIRSVAAPREAVGLTAGQYWERLRAAEAPTASGTGEPGIASTNLEYTIAASSLMVPADSPAALTVGAVAVSNDALEEYSSLGPTADGRVKPDMAAPARVCTTTYGACGDDGFQGTSAAAPHVTGAAALIKQANGGFSPAQLQAFLEQRATPLGPDGKDNSYGAGRLALGAPNPDGSETDASSLTITAVTPSSGPNTAPLRVLVKGAFFSTTRLPLVELVDAVLGPRDTTSLCLARATSGWSHEGRWPPVFDG